MNESIKKFLEKAEQDPAFITKMRAVQDSDEAYRLASSVQDGFTKEEFITAMKELAAANGDLTDADLKKFAGGTDTKEVFSIASATVSAINVSLGASAAAI